MPHIRVADSAPSPGGRFRRDGPFSGEWFRDDILAPALREAIQRRDPVTVVLDGTSGYGSSFLEEVFGGLIRTGTFSRDQLRAYLKIEANTPLFEPYKTLAEKFIQQARRAA